MKLSNNINKSSNVPIPQIRLIVEIFLIIIWCLLVTVPWQFFPSSLKKMDFFGQEMFYIMVTALVFFPILIYLSKYVYTNYKVLIDVKARDVAIGMFYAVTALIIVSFFLGRYASTDQPEEIIYVKARGVAEHFFLIISSFIFVAYEEVVFRLYIFDRVRILVNSKLTAVIIATVLYTGYYMAGGSFNIVGILYIMLFGLIYHLCYLSTRRIWTSILCHFFVRFFVYASFS